VSGRHEAGVAGRCGAPVEVAARIEGVERPIIGLGARAGDMRDEILTGATKRPEVRRSAVGDGLRGR
jgi:hypothetical protein